jgi:hypothetical protein
MTRETLWKGPARMLAQKAARYWWALVVVGVAWLVIGWVVLRADVTSLPQWCPDRNRVHRVGGQRGGRRQHGVRRVEVRTLRHLLAAWVSISDPQASIARRGYLILFRVGFMALLRGFTQMMLGFSLRHLGTETVSRDTGETGAGDVPPTVPAQERRGVSEPESAQQTVPRQ